MSALVAKTRGTIGILRHLPGQRRAHFRPRERLLADRDARVRAIVRHAADTVPYYRELFEREGIDPGELAVAEDLERLPILDRAVVQADPERFRSTSPAGTSAVELRTTGSSGTPLTVFHDRASLLANIAFAERERMVEAGMCGHAFRYRIVELSHEAATERRVRSVYGRTSFRPLRPERVVLSLARPPEQLLSEIDRLRPDVLVGYGGQLEHLFRTALRLGVVPHRPAAVVYGRDTMTDEGRALIETTFGIPVLSRYAAVEAFKIGFFCEERTGFHLHEDLCHVTIREDGRTCAPGETGEVVLTNLVNRATVLINYRLGDLATFAPEPCACGRTSHRLARLSGRADEILRLVDGTVVHPLQVWDVIGRRAEVRRYQLVQTEPQAFELRLLVDDEATLPRVAAALVPELRHLLAGGRVDVGRLDASLPNGRAKFRPVVALPASAEREGARR